MKNKNSYSLLIASICIGAGAMYLFDPWRGTYRRAIMRDKGLKFYRSTANYARKHMRDISNRRMGMIARAKNLISVQENLSDEVLIARVRASFGRVVSHPKSIYVKCDDGVVTLSGPILSREVGRLTRVVRKVPGVKEVVNSLTPYRDNKGISALQGDGPAYLS